MTERQHSPTFEAALILPVLEAEPLVAEYRRKFDPSAAVGVPSHITVNYPFTPHFTRPAEARRMLSILFSTYTKFGFTLSEIRTFPGVIYLTPDPQEPFLALIAAVASAFPDSPPYEGQFPDPVPHLTVAQAEESALPRIRANFAADAAQALPIPATATEVWLMDNTETQWKTRAVFPFKLSMDSPPA